MQIIIIALIASVSYANAVPGVQGDAFVDGSSSWTGYFEITFVTNLGDTLEAGPYYNEIGYDYRECFRNSSWVNMACTLYFSNGWVRAYKYYSHVELGTVPYPVQNIYFEPPNPLSMGSANLILLGNPEPLSLDAVTWGSIKRLVE